MGGRALKNRTLLSHKTGLENELALDDFKPYLAQAKAFARATINSFAKNIGGGYISAATASVITTASLQLAASRYQMDKASQTGDADLMGKASRLGDASRANLLSAMDMAAVSAAEVDPLDRWRVRE